MKKRKLQFKQIFTVGLTALAAATAIYAYRDDGTGFGLIASAQTGSAIPIVTSFRIAPMTDKKLFSLDVKIPKKLSQTKGIVWDEKNPPEVKNPQALNTGTGGEIALYWARLDGVEMVNIYRQTGEWQQNSGGELIIKKSNLETTLDTNVENNVLYSYKIVSVVTTDTTEYESKNAEVISATPSDDIPPQAPTNVTVVSKKGRLEILWENPSDEDLDRLAIYRSKDFGSTGEVIVNLEKTTNSYVDSVVQANETYFYTVVTYDKSGNSSGLMQSVPVVGNSSPFTIPANLFSTP